MTRKMGRRTEKTPRSHTLPSSPTHSFSSSSSSDFEFTISISPRKSSAALCPADELFYKGQLLPLHLSPRLSMVRTLLLSSSSTSSSTSTSTNARHSTGSSTDSHSSFTDSDSSRPSSATDDDEFKRLHPRIPIPNTNLNPNHQIKKPKYLSLSRFSSVFRTKDPKPREPDSTSGSTAKRAKEAIRKYLKKVKPLYEKISQKQRSSVNLCLSSKTDRSTKERENSGGSLSHSFSGNLRYPRKRSVVSSCPSSMRSSPSHSGVLYRTGLSGTNPVQKGTCYADASSMEELQSAIQGAIAHCKNSMVQNKSIMVSDEI